MRASPTSGRDSGWSATSSRPTSASAARTPLLGNLWWVLDPLLQMVVYVVFVTIIVTEARCPTTRSSSSRRSCPGSGSPRRSPTRPSSIVSQDQLIKQIQFPKIVLPTAATVAGIVSFAFGTDRPRAPDAVLPAPDLAYLLLIPVIAAVQFVFTLACAYLVAAGNVFFRDLGNVEGHVLRLWWFLSPGLYSLAVARRAERSSRSIRPCGRSSRRTRSRSCSRPTGRSSTGHRDGGRPACPTSRRSARCSSRASSSSAFDDGRLQAPRAELREGHLMAAR